MAYDFPTSPTNGQTANGYIWNGYAWLGGAPAGGSGGVAISIGDDPPDTPTDGQLWFESDTGAFFIYYDDCTSQAWVQVNNVALPAEPLAEFTATYTVSSTFAGYTGHTGTGAGLRDGIATGSASVWGNNSEPTPFIKADLGSTKSIDHIDVMAIPAAFDGWGISYLNGTAVTGSTDDVSYTAIAVITGVVEGVYKSIPVGANYRYIKIGKPSGDLALSEFRIY